MQVTLIIIATFVVIGLVFYAREQYTTYPSTNERRLNTIKQLADDVIRDIRKTSPQVYAQGYAVQPITTQPIYTQPIYTKPTTQPRSQASIPTWVRNLTSTAAVEQLRLLNPGYTVRRIPMGSALTREYQSNRITVVYDVGSDRVISASQG